MDEEINNEAPREPEFTNPSRPAVDDPSAPTPGEAGAAESDARSRLRAEAHATLNHIRGERGFMGLFSFEKMYFPFFARVLFIIYCALMIVVGLIMAASALYAMFTEGFLNGLIGLFISGIFVIASIVAGRIWIELVMVAFSINEAVQDIRDTLRARIK